MSNEINANCANISKNTQNFAGFPHFTSNSKSINISGIVPQLIICEISAIDEPTDVSRSYAFGMTIVLSPSGIATEQIIQSDIPFGIGKNIRGTMKIIGITIRRIIETT